MNLLLSLPKCFKMLFLFFSGLSTNCRLQNNRYGMECVVGVDGGTGLALRFELCVWISVSNSVCDL